MKDICSRKIFSHIKVGNKFTLSFEENIIAALFFLLFLPSPPHLLLLSSQVK
jgi:hypothetical protein